MPFVIKDQMIYDCHHGKDCHSAAKEDMKRYHIQYTENMSSSNLILNGSILNGSYSSFSNVCLKARFVG